MMHIIDHLLVQYNYKDVYISFTSKNTIYYKTNFVTVFKNVFKKESKLYGHRLDELSDYISITILRCKNHFFCTTIIYLFYVGQ